MANRNILFYKTTDTFIDKFGNQISPCRNLIKLMKQGGVSVYFQFMNLDNLDVTRKAPVENVPTLFIVGDPEPKEGKTAFDYITNLIAAKQQQTMQQELVNNTEYQTRMMMLKQRAQEQVGALGFHDKEMSSFSDTYAALGDAMSSMPQNYVGMKDDANSILTPPVVAKMDKETQDSMLRLMESKRTEQEAFFKNQADLTIKQHLHRFTGK
jgi:hypothetical protein